MVRRTASAAVWAHRRNKEPDMRTRPLMTTALATAGLLMAGGVAFAAANSVSTTPDPQVVIPSSASTDRHGGADDPPAHDARDDKTCSAGTSSRSDDPATHEAGDDKGGTRTSTVGSNDDPVTHDANDDKGGTRTSTVGSNDDPVTHDANDDKGGTRSSGATTRSDDPATHEAGDDK